MKIGNYDYDLRDRVGTGGYAWVYKAKRDSDPNTIYALKVIELTKKEKQEQLIKTIKREIEVLREFQSENVIKLLDHKFLEEDIRKEFYLFFEYAHF